VLRVVWGVGGNIGVGFTASWYVHVHTWLYYREEFETRFVDVEILARVQFYTTMVRVTICTSSLWRVQVLEYASTTGTTIVLYCKYT
jgi:hypothetical protein